MSGLSPDPAFPHTCNAACGCPAAARARGAQGDSGGGTSARTGAGAASPQSPAGVNGKLTPQRGGRNATSAGGTTWRRPDPRKQTIEHKSKFLLVMLRGFFKLCREHPEQGLPWLLKLERMVKAEIGPLGTGLVAEEGPSTVAAELSRELGEAWSKQRVDNRWGGGSDA